MNHCTSILVIFLLISLVPCQSNASSLVLFRKLVQVNHNSQPKPIKSDQNSPSPSPVPSANSNTGDAQSPMNQPESDICDMVSNKCHIARYKITACVPSLGNGSGGSYMLVLNDYESSLKLNISVRPVNEILENIVILAHQVKKIREGSHTLIPYPCIRHGYFVKNGEFEQHRTCVYPISFSDRFLLPSAVSGDEGSQGFYTTYFTPIGGTYLLFAAGLLIAGTWACCKLGKRGRRLDGVPYRALEMGQQDSNSSSIVGTAEYRDQSWDEDWDEEKATKSSRGNHVGKRLRPPSSSRGRQKNDNSMLGRKDWIVSTSLDYTKK